MRGNLALALQLDGLFPGDDADDTRTYTRSVARRRHRDVLPRGRAGRRPAGRARARARRDERLDAAADRRAVARLPRAGARTCPATAASQAKSDAHAAPFLGNWLVAFLRETCTEPAVLVGNSLGGRTSLEAALDIARTRCAAWCCCARPSRFASCGSSCRSCGWSATRSPRCRCGSPRPMAMRGLRSLFADPNRLPPAWYEAAIDEFVRVLELRANRLAIFSALRHVYLDEPFGESGFWERLPALRAAGAVRVGRQDVLVPAGFSRFVAEALPRRRVGRCSRTAGTCRSSSTPSSPPRSPASSSPAAVAHRRRVWIVMRSGR